MVYAGSTAAAECASIGSMTANEGLDTAEDQKMPYIGQAQSNSASVGGGVSQVNGSFAHCLAADGDGTGAHGAYNGHANGGDPVGSNNYGQESVAGETAGSSEDASPAIGSTSAGTGTDAGAFPSFSSTSYATNQDFSKNWFSKENALRVYDEVRQLATTCSAGVSRVNVAR